ncbi:MAG: PilZ domain-containing protein [Candidatus Korobacteraceae bacterium]
MKEKTNSGGKPDVPLSSTEGAVLASAGWKENRHRFRSPIELPVRITTCDDRGGRRLVTATCTDFSDDGVAFETAMELKVGDIVLLEFLMAGEFQSLDRSLVRIIHRQAAGYGACFVKPVAG